LGARPATIVENDGQRRISLIEQLKEWFKPVVLKPVPGFILAGILAVTFGAAALIHYSGGKAKFATGESLAQQEENLAALAGDSFEDLLVDHAGYGTAIEEYFL